LTRWGHLFLVRSLVIAHLRAASGGTRLAIAPDHTPQHPSRRGRNAMDLIKRLAHDEEAGTAVEYGLITAVIAVALIAALVAFRNEIVGMFSRAGNRVRSTT
jgi:pilus assembly protein Flp/PilA